MEENLIEEIPEYQEWIKAIKGSTFFGKRLEDMSRDELIGVIGWMNKDNERTVTQMKKDHAFLMDIEKSQRKNHIHIGPVLFALFFFFLLLASL